MGVSGLDYDVRIFTFMLEDIIFQRSNRPTSDMKTRFFTHFSFGTREPNRMALIYAQRCPELK